VGTDEESEMKDQDAKMFEYTSWLTKHGGFARDMTIRDYFAAAMVSSGTVFKNGQPADTPEAVARQAYELADAILKAREQ
jgi:hypothetical protein